MTLNDLRDEMFTYAEKQGFHEAPFNFGESLMLIVSELSEQIIDNDSIHKSAEKHYPNLYAEVMRQDKVSNSSWYYLSDLAFEEFKKFKKMMIRKGIWGK